MVQVSMIAALAAGRVIGSENRMPWHLPADLRHFRQVTLGKPVIMGRRTFESIGRPLPGRTNIVLTRDRHWQAPGVLIAHTPRQSLDLAGQADEVMIIGGGSVYEHFLPIANRLYLTYIDARLAGDTRFADYRQYANEHGFEWRMLDEQRHPADEHNPYDLRFVILARSR
jgi:dihydrofolate reductase